jgi:prepilin-type N-terminal cleavage/methylation domain-containing protein
MITRITAWFRKRRSAGTQGDGGFTLIELLVVLVILPMIIGAVAEATIVSFENQPSTSNRLSDTTNAELTSEYFTRDVQGASEVTTDQQLFESGSYSQSSPQVCGVSGSDTLLVALYRAPDNGASALDVAYWEHTDNQGMIDVIRYACTLQPNFASASPVSEVLDGPPPGTESGNANLTQQISPMASISPSEFAESASSGWASTAPQTTVQAEISAFGSAGIIDVSSTAGFVPGAITVSTRLGAGTVTCSGVSETPPSFTGCGGWGPGAVVDAEVVIGAPVTESISAIQLSVDEPTSSYDFNVLGIPR